MYVRWPAIGFWAVLTEVLAHFLSLTWGFSMLVVAFVWVAGMLRTASVKAQSTEARVNALVTSVGTVNNTANSAQSTANAVQSQVSGLSIPQGTPGGYPAVGSPPNSALATYINNVVVTLINAGVC